MVRLWVPWKRLSLGSWSTSFEHRSNRAVGGAARRYSAMAAPIIKQRQNQISTTADVVAPTAPTTDLRSRSNLIELAAIIMQETEKLDRYLKENGLPHPGFDVDSPVNFSGLPEEIKRTRETVIAATRELGELVTGPTEGVRWMAWDVGFLSFFFPGMN